jgi:hypothetical protein
MYLDVRPEGTALTTSQAKTLDDEFFLFDPLGHFSSRIATLLHSANADVPLTRASQPAFFDALGLKGVDELFEATRTSRDTRTAVEAVALRHQCAEALSRFLHAIVAARPVSPDAVCTWVAIAEGPMKTVDVLTATKAVFDADGELLLRVLFPAGTVVTGDVRAAADTAVAWINHAVELLTGNELSLNAAHNKLKHGLAVATRDDIRVELTTTPPDEDGNIPVSAFGEGKSLPIFDRPLLTYLSRPRAKPVRGIEAVYLRVDVPTVLAETWMMAVVYAALFRVAALNHFGPSLPAEVARYPPLVVGRTPEQVIGAAPLGFRSPVTLPTGEGDSPRPAGLFFHHRFWPMQIDLESRSQATVVDG